MGASAHVVWRAAAGVRSPAVALGGSLRKVKLEIQVSIDGFVAGAIDEFHVIVNPTVLGAGRPMFGKIGSRADLKLVGARSFPCGVAVLHYARK